MKGVELAEKNKWDEAQKLLEQALAANPKPDLEARPYGTFVLEYIPHYYLARCAFQKGDYESARKFLEEAISAGAAKSSKAGELVFLRNRIQAKLQEAAQTQPQ